MAEHGAEDWRAAFQAAHPELPDWFATAGVDLSKRLAALTIPALLLWGDADPVSSVAVGRRLAALLPGPSWWSFPAGTMIWRMTPSIERADGSAAAVITALTAELLEEIQAAIGERVFHFDAGRNRALLEGALESGRCVVFLARAPHPECEPLGFLALCEGFALYAEGAFGIITELYVAPPHRSRGLGSALLDAAREHGCALGWSRLEVTTPPLPAFARTLGFYEREGFAVSGGRKLRCLIGGAQEP